ncbi:MAG: hypothetical protein K0R38_6962 [Polyangiaceae bacterium]|jgi:hypothetical protein|nr:hypothetical protein [Polyangiaceae bacterium]
MPAAAEPESGPVSSRSGLNATRCDTSVQRGAHTPIVAALER